MDAGDLPLRELLLGFLLKMLPCLFVPVPDKLFTSFLFWLSRPLNRLSIFVFVLRLELGGPLNLGE